MKTKQLIGVLLMAMAMGMGFVSCEKDDVSVGIEVNLRNGNNGGGNVNVLNSDFLGGGSVYLSIDKSDNFRLDYYGSVGEYAIVSVGYVSGLSRVNKIPQSGWSSMVSVNEGCGYIIRAKAKGSSEYHYARVYVTDILTGASSGGVIGATIRYQPDWQ